MHMEMENFETTSRRRMREVYEHRPSELLFSVNGFVLSSLKVTAERSEQTQTINIDEKVSFIEVFSEQGVRLLFLDVEPLPDGPVVQTTELNLSDNRKLQLRLSFSDPRPTLRVVYEDPLMKPLGSGYACEETELTGAQSTMPAQQAWYERQPGGLRNFDKRFSQTESEFTQKALLNVKARLDIQKTAAKPQSISSIGRITAFFDRLRLKIAAFSSALSWRFVTVPAALCLVFVGLIIWFAISPSSNTSASEILSESERRTAIWENQPDKVLHWGYEVTFSNHLGGLPDGKYISLHWQNNTGGKASRLNRLYDANGVLVSAVWVRKDGSEVYFSRSRADEIRITPTSDVLLSYAARLDEKSRQALKNFVRSSDQVWQMHRESHLEIKQKYINPLEGSVQIIQTADAGKVFRVRSVRLTGKDKSILLEEIDDVAADSFKLLRSHQVIRYSDGKTAITDSQLKLYQETSVEDFDAHDLSAQLRQVKRIIQISPEEVLKIAELDERAKKNDQQAK
jgi:hypothetical protein